MTANYSTTQSGAPVVDDSNSSALGRDGAIASNGSGDIFVAFSTANTTWTAMRQFR